MSTGSTSPTAERHRCQRLHPAEADDLVRPRGRDRVERRVVHPAALARRRAGHHAPDPRDLRHHDRHERGRDHRVAAARHVGADRVHRHVAMAESHARKRLQLEVRERSALGFSEAAHLFLRERDVLLQLVGNGRGGRVDLGAADDKRVGRPTIQLQRPVAHRGLAPALDVGQHRRDRVADVLTRVRRHRVGALQHVRHA